MTSASSPRGDLQRSLLAPLRLTFPRATLRRARRQDRRSGASRPRHICNSYLVFKKRVSSVRPRSVGLTSRFALFPPCGGGCAALPRPRGDTVSAGEFSEENSSSSPASSARFEASQFVADRPTRVARLKFVHFAPIHRSGSSRRSRSSPVAQRPTEVSAKDSTESTKVDSRA